MEIQQGVSELDPTEYVASIAVEGETPLTGAVTLSEGSNITLTQVGNDIEIASTGGGGTPGGSDTQVQFNDGGSFGGDAGLTYNKTTDTLAVLGNIELGHASANTLSASGGVLSIEGVVIPTISSTNTLTNKRRTRRLTTTNAPGATPTTNTDNVDIMNFTGLNTAITSMTTNLSGTPVDGDLLEFRFTDDGTGRGITWGASFAATTVALPTTTVANNMLRVGFEFSGTTWKCIATA